MCPALLRFIVALGCTAAVAWAQAPESVLILKLNAYDQDSGIQITPAGAGFGVYVTLDASTVPIPPVNFRAPDGQLRALTRVGSVEFEFFEEFTDRAAMEAEFPNGTYTILSGNRSTPVTVSGGSGVAPVRITNFDQLQGLVVDRLQVEWEPIPGATTDDFLSVYVEDLEGNELFSTADSFPPTSTSVLTGYLPPAVPLLGHLSFMKITGSTGGTGTTAIGVAQGFLVRFPLLRREPPPVFIYPPKGIVTVIGANPSFSTHAQGASSYVWRKDGIVLDRNTPNLPFFPVQASDAGTYTVEIINTAGRVTSPPAELVIAPSLSLTVAAGQLDSPGMADGPVATAQFSTLTAIASDAAGQIFVVDGNAVRKISGGIVTTIAGRVDQPGNLDGPAASARFRNPRGIAVDAAGTLYIADTGNQSVRRLTPDGQVTTLARDSFSPHGIAVDATGRVFVSCPEERYVAAITPGGAVSLLYRREDAPVVLSVPRGLALDPAGNLFIADQGTGEIVRIATDGTVTIHAGNATSWTGWSETLGGVGTSVNLRGALAIAAGSDGHLFVTTQSSQVWRISPLGAVARLTETAWHFQDIGGVAVDPSGAVHVIDSARSVILRGTPVDTSHDPRVAVTEAPASQTMAIGERVAFRVTATGPGLAYQWFKDGKLIPGANDPLLVLPATAPAQIFVRVGNPIGTVDSPTAALAVSTGAPSRLVNLSLRAPAGLGAETLIMGFVIDGGSPGTSRSLLLRGVGPGLEPYSVPGYLRDPRLSLHDAGGSQIAFNDDWARTEALEQITQAVGAFALSSGSRDAALLATLPTGPHTVQINGANDATGVALAEAYDADPTGQGGARLTNVSARTRVGAGDDTLTAGFVIAGATAKTVLIRAVGPALRYHNVTGWVVNPKLEVFRGQERLAENNDWSGSQLPALFSSVGAFPLSTDSLDAALVLTLPPGPYTVQVTAAPFVGAVGLLTGIALVEVYEVP